MTTEPDTQSPPPTRPGTGCVCEHSPDLCPLHSTSEIDPTLPYHWGMEQLHKAEAYLDRLAEGNESPPADRYGMETAIAFDLKRLTGELEDSQARALAIAKGFASEQGNLRIRITSHEAVLEELLRIRIREGGEKAKRSLRVPGAGTLSLRRTGGRWSVSTPRGRWHGSPAAASRGRSSSRPSWPRARCSRSARASSPPTGGRFPTGLSSLPRASRSASRRRRSESSRCLTPLGVANG